MWVPSHVGILGNEYADSAANEAKNRPLLKICTWERRDILNEIYSSLESSYNSRWQSYQHYYKNVNPIATKPIFPKYSSRNETSTITRLRIGHCKFSHNHLLEKTAAPNCSTCNTQLTISHLLDVCRLYNNSRTKIFGSNLPSEYLKNTCDNNIKLICKYLLENNLKQLI